MTTTTDLSLFGKRELKELELLLRAWRQNGLPKDFNEDMVVPMFNQDSGLVFLTNADYQVAMRDNETLYSFYTCPYCGEEGCEEDIRGHSDESGCRDWEADTFEQEEAASVENLKNLIEEIK